MRFLTKIQAFQITAKRAVHLDDIFKYLADNPSASLTKAAKHFGLSDAAFHVRFKKNNITYKKSEIIEEALLRQYIDENPGKSIQKTSEHFAVKPSQLIHLMQKFGIKKPKSHSFKLDIDVVKKYISDHPDATLLQISSHFKVSERFIRKLVETKKIEYTHKKKGFACRMDPDALQQYIDQHPDANYEDIAEHFKCSAGHISVLVQKFKIVYKKKSLKRKVEQSYCLRLL